MLPARFNEFDRRGLESAPKERAYGAMRFSVSPEIAGERSCERAEAGAPADFAFAEGVARSNEEMACRGTYRAPLKAVSDLHLLTRRVPRNTARPPPRGTDRR